MVCECHPLMLLEEKVYSVPELEEIIHRAKELIEMLEVEDHE